MISKAGSIPNHVNLLVNGDFTRTETSGSQTFAADWERLSGISANALNGVVTKANAGMPTGLDGNAMRVQCYCNTGSATQQQTINVKGGKGDIFVFGGWVNATSVASGATHFKPALVTKFKNTSGSWSKWQYREFDAQRVGWKYGEWAIAAPSDYTAMLAGFTYSHNTGTAMFAELFVYREEYGESFKYDDKKNLTGVAALSGKQSAIEYNDADNVKSYR